MGAWLTTAVFLLWSNRDAFSGDFLRGALAKPSPRTAHNQSTESTFVPAESPHPALCRGKACVFEEYRCPEQPPLALLFSMDTLPAYLRNAARGGPSGEMLVRESFQGALCRLGWDLHSADSDAEMQAALGGCQPPRVGECWSGRPSRCPTMVVVDEFTLFGKPPGHVRSELAAYAEARRVLVLSFFGRRLSPTVMEEVGASSVLTTYRSPKSGTGEDLGYTPLGFSFDSVWFRDYALAHMSDLHRHREAVLSCRVAGSAAREWQERFRGLWKDSDTVSVQQLTNTLELPIPAALEKDLFSRDCGGYGLLWGKQADYWTPQLPVVTAILDRFQRGSPLSDTTKLEGRLCIVTNIPPKVFGSHPGVVSLGPVPKEEWHAVLRSACFLLGAGRPLAGPSAIEAMAHGATFINPKFPPVQNRAKRGKLPYETAPDLSGFDSQHPEAGAIGAFPGDPVPSRHCLTEMLDSGVLVTSTVVKCVSDALLHSHCPLRSSGASLTDRVRISEPPPFFTEEQLMGRVRLLVEKM
jgi:hypothetical protein